MLRSNAVLKPMELDLIAHTNTTNEIRHAGFNNELLHVWYTEVYFTNTTRTNVIFVSKSNTDKCDKYHICTTFGLYLSHVKSVFSPSDNFYNCQSLTVR